MNILVTGGAGYIGSVVVSMLVDAGHSVTVLDNISESPDRPAVPGVRFVQGDIADISSLITPDDDVEAVFHLASYIAAGESVKDPAKYWENNTIKTLRMLEGMHSLGIRKLIFSSTAAVYGNPDTMPITEDTPTRPTNTYGMTKLAVDMAITSYAAAFGLAATSLRYFNVAGAYGRYGERHRVETHIIPLALATAAGDREMFSVFGTDYPTPDGTCVRDYIHVADLARAHLLALDHLQPGKHTIYNLSTGNGFSNKEVVAAVERVTGRPLPVEYGPRREGDPAVLVASNARAQQELGWTPEHTSIDVIVQDAWNFYQQLHAPADSR